MRQHKNTELFRFRVEPCWYLSPWSTNHWKKYFSVCSISVMCVIQQLLRLFRIRDR